MRRLLPPPAVDVDPYDAYADAPGLRVGMVMSADGSATDAEGWTDGLGGAADLRVFRTLRALADAVVVGAQTVRQEQYTPARERAAFAARRAAAGQSPAPAIAVVSASLDLDFTLPLFTAPAVPTLVLTGAAAPQDRVRAARRAGAEVVFAGEGAGVDPGRVPGVLAERGLRRLLTEGGPKLLGQFLAADVLDELCLTLSPRAVAGTAARVSDAPQLTVPAEFTLQSLLEHEGFLFTRYRRRR